MARYYVYCQRKIQKKLIEIMSTDVNALSCTYPVRFNVVKNWQAKVPYIKPFALFI